MSFANKVVIVTGASSGIGAATAVLFAKQGAHVAMVARNETKLKKVAQLCVGTPTSPLIIKADVSNEKEASTIVKKTVDRFGKLDVLVNNAGILRYASVADPNVLKTYDEVMNTNLRSIVQLTSFAAPHLMKTKGNIVNVSSMLAVQVPGEKFMAYCVSKAGMDHFTRCAARDLGASGVRVNAVSPGPVRTELAENSGNFPAGTGGEAWEQWKHVTVSKKLGEPEEIADVIAFLASDKAGNVAGSIWLSDGGATVMAAGS